MSSIAMQMTKKMMREQYALQGINRKDGSFDPMTMRAASDASMKQLPPEQGVTFTPVGLGLLAAEECLPAEQESGAVLFYIHGGGLVAGNAETSRFYASVLANASHFPVYTASYRLAPENVYPAFTDDCLSGYEALLKEYPDTPIVLIGESGGAYLSVMTALLAKEKGLRLPAAVIAYSVIVDVTGMLDRSRNEETDVSLSNHALNQLWQLAFPDETSRAGASPMTHDFTGFPPLLLAWDAGEILSVDSEWLAQEVEKAGGEVSAKAYDDAFHAFPTLGHMLPESEEVLQNTLAFIKAQI